MRRTTIPTKSAQSLQRVRKAILFIDMVDSVRLMDADESSLVSLWLDLVGRFETEILPPLGGRLVKMMGDGLLIAFDDARSAAAAALRINRMMDDVNAGRPPQTAILLRMGLDAGDVMTTKELDLYGRTVNVAARLQTLGGPGDIVATAEVRDMMPDELDASFEDIGECYLRNLPHPVRAFRVRAPDAAKRITPLIPPHDPRPTIAVIPPAPTEPGARDGALGDVIAETLIAALSRMDEINVISRLSTTGFQLRAATATEAGAALGADFVMSGTCAGDGDAVRAEVELAEARTGGTVWTGRIDASVNDLLSQDGCLTDLAGEMFRALVRSSIRKSLSHPPPTLESYALLMSGVALMHRLSPRDFKLARRLLETLVERDRRQPLPLAWLARWHVLAVVQGWTDSPRREAAEALECTRHALDLDPRNVPALVAEGFVLNNLMRKLEDAERRYDLALVESPNDAAGRLLRGVLYAFRGQGAEAMRETERALRLAPLDPHRHFYQSLAASACIAAESYGRALDLANSSLRMNRAHTTTLRVKAVAQMRLGQRADARETVKELMRIQPGLTVSGWLSTAPSAEFEVGRRFAETMLEAGVPA